MRRLLGLNGLDREVRIVEPGRSVAADGPQRAPSPRQLGAYTVGREIATTLRYQVRLGGNERGERFALKFVHPHYLESLASLEPVDEARFRGVACGGAALVHENVERFWGLESDGEVVFLVTEYVAGVNLGNLLRAGRERVPPDAAVAVAAYVIAEAAEGLHAAHELRDAEGTLIVGAYAEAVRPRGIRISFDGAVKIESPAQRLLSRELDKAYWHHQHVSRRMNPRVDAYLTPERVRGSTPDRRSDVFSLGTMLWELVAAARLFLRESTFDTLRATLDAEAPPLASFAPHCPDALDAIARRALAKSPSDRFATARGLADALRAFSIEYASCDGRQALEAHLHRAFSRSDDAAPP